MPAERRYADDLAYWQWHRPASITRWLSMSEADSLLLIDRDPGSEACRHCAKTLLLVEAVRGDAPKSARVTKRLAQDAGCKAMLVRYVRSENGARIPGSPELPDIVSFTVTRLWPEPELTHEFTPAQWAAYLLRVRREHREVCEA